ncbi:MAG: hypothetical protein KAT25_02395 [Sulfuriflexus sp.]|nr:hypothetical protein [Sulfuriflexus sp.]
MAEFPDNRLILYPRAIGARANRSALLGVLKDAGLIADELARESVNGMEGHHLVGERFFEHVSFLGCSPHLKLEPPEQGEDSGTDEFCHISVSCDDNVSFFGGNNVRAPQCPQCKAVENDWQALMPRWEKAPEVFTYQCTECGATKPMHMLNWRRSAGFAAVSVHIWGVHQSEAVPNDGLLKELEALTFCPWEYFYRIS